MKEETKTQEKILYPKACILIQTRKKFPKIDGNLNELSMLDDGPYRPT